MTDTPNRQQPKTLVILLGIAILAGLGVVVALQLTKRSSTPSPASTNQAITNTANVNLAVDTTNTNQPVDTDSVPPTNVSVDQTTTYSSSFGSVTWTAPTATDSLGLVNSQDEYEVKNSKYYSVGQVTSGTFKGADIILVTVSYDDPSPYPGFFRFLKQGTTYTLLTKSSDGDDPSAPRFKTATITQNTKAELPGLNFPETLNGPKPKQTLERDANVNAFFDPKDLTVAFTDKTYGTVYTRSATPSTAPDAGFLSTSNFNTRNGFYLRVPDGTVAVYKLTSSLITKNSDNYSEGFQPGTMTWTDGTKNTATYSPTDIGGCGSRNYISVVTGIDRAADLSRIGTASNGDPVYELKDTNHELLKSYYDNTYVVPDATNTSNPEWKKSSYAAYLATHPIAFWVDPFDRLIKLSNSSYGPQAECGKPVIYLYPTATTNVNVAIAPPGGLLLSEPVYGNGWTVRAEPNGTLTNLADGLKYPYLFWEGRGGVYSAPVRGFLVARDSVHGFLKEKLAALGLNAKESADFIEFWEPRMQSAPWYHVSFYGNREMDRLAPLTVTPKPDTIIRVLMDYRPLQTPEPIQGYTITTPVRKGFTVVEWGGVIR